MSSTNSDWLVECLKSENAKLKQKIADLEQKLDLSVQSTGEYLTIDGIEIKGVTKTTSTGIVITSEEFIRRLF